MKRFALCLSGQPRFYQRAYQQIKEHIIDVNPNIDIFFHCWHQSDGFMTGASWTQEDVADRFDENIPFKLINLYKPKNCLFEPQKHDLSLSHKKWEDYPLTNGENLAFVTHSMFYSMMMASKLCHDYEKSNDFKYDLIIRTRFDLGILSPLKLDDFTPKENGICYADVCSNKSVMSDLLFWGTSENMKNLCELYNHIDEYVELGTLLCGEEMLTKHLKTLNLVKTPLPISLFLVRDKDFKYPNVWGRMW